MVDGGFVIFDDYYTYEGCAIAVHEFLGERRVAHRIESVIARSNGYEYLACALLRKGKTTWCDTRNWMQLLHLAAREITSAVPPGESFILVDEDELPADELFGGRRRIRFLEREGQYSATPRDDDTAIRELERLRRSGAHFMVFTPPAFWWADCYAGLHRHLRSKFRCILENERLVVFDLR